MVLGPCPGPERIPYTLMSRVGYCAQGDGRGNGASEYVYLA